MGKGYLYAGSWLDEKGLSGGGIHLFKQDASDGALELIDTYREDIAAGYICISEDRKYLYAVDEIKRKPDSVQTDGSIYAFRINQTDGTLSEINHISSCGVFPNYLTITADGRLLFGVNYGSEDVVVRSRRNKNGEFELENIYEESSMFSVKLKPGGGLGEICDMKIFSGEPARFFEWFQASPHPHCIGIDPSGRMLLVADRGCDEIVTCNFNETDGMLHNFKTYKTEHGIGPRNCVFHPVLPYVYIAGEVKPYILMFAYDTGTAELTLVRQYRTVKEELVYNGKNVFFDCAHPSDIRIHPNGRFLYIANRGPDTVTCFQIHEKDGTLSFLSQIHTQGSWPWSFALDCKGEYMYIGNKNTKNITVFQIDANGVPVFSEEVKAVERTVCLKFLELDSDSEVS